jgi:cytochrome c553
MTAAPRTVCVAPFSVKPDGWVMWFHGNVALVAALAFVVGAATDALAAGNAAAGRQKALMCQTCHGLDGKAKIPEAPNLAGQSEVYLVKALNDYRSGARKNDMMSLVAPTLKDNDIDDLAAYYAAIEVTVGPPPK